LCAKFLLFSYLFFKSSLTSQGIESNRVVLALEGEKTLGKFLKGSDYEKYQCYSNRVYLIVGKISLPIECIDSKEFDCYHVLI